MKFNIYKYTIYFIITDSICSLILNLFQKNPVPVIAVSLVIRAFFLLFSIPVIGYIFVSQVFKDYYHLVSLSITHITVYILMPVFIYMVSDNTDGLKKAYLDLNTDKALFMSICAPYLGASLLLIAVSGNSKIFKD